MPDEARREIRLVQAAREAANPGSRIFDDAQQHGYAARKMRRRERALPFRFDAAPVGEVRHHEERAGRLGARARASSRRMPAGAVRGFF